MGELNCPMIPKRDVQIDQDITHGQLISTLTQAFCHSLIHLNLPGLMVAAIDTGQFNK